MKKKLKCKKCKKQWWPRVEDPKLCPYCKCREWKTWKKKN